MPGRRSHTGKENHSKDILGKGPGNAKGEFQQQKGVAWGSEFRTWVWRMEKGWLHMKLIGSLGGLYLDNSVAEGVI